MLANKAASARASVPVTVTLRYLAAELADDHENSKEAGRSHARCLSCDDRTTPKEGR